MSAESPRRGLHKGIQIISPQPISDRSIIDSVAGIINDIVPQAYVGAPNLDSKESITWARFEYADVNDPSLFPEYLEGSGTPPLLLVLGYTTGVQVWLVAASGEATQVLSWRQSIIKILRILPDPKKDEDYPDIYEQKRPIIAICDSAGPGPQFCSVNFISLRTGEQLKSIKFKNPVCDVLANKRSIVVTFSEKIAVFDAWTFEDVLTVTSCYASPGPNPNPVALGTRWLAYNEKKLLPARRSSGGSEGEGVQSYTAAVLYAAKSLGKGLRGLGETVASSLSGNSVIPMAMNNTGGDVSQPGVVTILDLQAAKQEKEFDDATIETVVAHFTAHSDAIVAMTFDLTGAILMTADRRGHDFHVFRIQPHPGGPSLAAVHHLYVLHRGDTTAKVQDMVFSSDTRWAAVSTVRGTTHVFPVAPYGGSVGMRTHSTPHVVNRLSRFHKSAGLTDDGTRSHSPVSHIEMPISVYPYSNPRLPPYPHPTVLHPLAQIRQPSVLNHVNNQLQSSRPQQRQRLYSDDNSALPLKICACFAPSRAWIYSQRDTTTNKVTKRAVDSLFIMACHGNMIQYDLETKPASGVPKEKVCDDTMIELEIEAKGQWPLQRTPNSFEILPPLTPSSPLLCYTSSPKTPRHSDGAEDRWLSQVEIVTHAGPHRRLWMGPQFIFKTYNAPSGVNVMESDAIEIGISGGSRPARSNPVNMPHATRPLMPVVIDGSGSSYEQSPRFMEAYGDSLEGENVGMGNGENQLREDLAEAMLETSTAGHRATGRRLVVERVGQPVTKVVNPLGTVITILADEEDASSSQEFDDIDECAPEAPRSLCAEEGPASLGDFDSEGNPLRNLTEICAEMRAAREPAIDNVLAEDIQDIKERKTLCVEAATMNSADNAIDFERVGAFRDIPTSLSLCVEPGEILSSPMSQARENLWAKKTTERREYEKQEKSFADAKYVVNYDEEGVTLTENSPLSDEKSLPNVKESTKRSNKNNFTNSRASKRIASIQRSKFTLHEHEDSVVIEDTRATVQEKLSKSIPTKKSQASKKIEKTLDDIELGTKVFKKEVKKSFKNLDPMIIEGKPDQPIDPRSSFVELQVSDVIVGNSSTYQELPQPMEATVAIASGVAMLPHDFPIVDDDYQIVEVNSNLGHSNQSDDDIEHIHSSDVVLDLAENKIEEYEISPIRFRKSSKSTISDDDLEHINASELVELFDRAKSLVMDSTIELLEVQEGLEKPFKPATCSDDDLEYVPQTEGVKVDENSLEAPSSAACIPDLTRNTGTNSKKSSKCAGTTEKINAVRQRTSRKRKDVLVIESEDSQADVTVIVKSLEMPDTWNKSKSPEKDLTEEIDLCVEPKDRIADPVTSQSLPKKTRVRTTKSSASPHIQKPNHIEIIDIDAMQKAEMEIASNNPASECKILEEISCQAIPVTKLKKSRRNKEIEGENVTPLKQNVQNLQEKSTEKINWSLIAVKTEVCEIESQSTIADKVLETESVNGVPKSLIINDPIKSKKKGKKSVNSDPTSNKECSTSGDFNSISTQDSAIIAENLSTNAPCAIDANLRITKTNEEIAAKASIGGEMSATDSKEVKKEDLNEEAVPERSSSSDDLNANIVPMDTEEDGGMREVIEKNTSITASTSWSTVGKKNNKSKKKKRR